VEDTSYGDVISRNIRALRARKRLDQGDVVERMRDLGFTTWHRPTLGRVERGERRLFAEELVGLVLALEAPWGNLLFPAAGEMRIVSLPNSHPVILPLQHEMPEGTTSSLWWDGNKAMFTSPDPGEAGS
jgi:transcriptional regulator with XRE-family HTH domain